MPLASTINWSFGKLTPCQYQELARQMNVKLAASASYAPGEVLGEVTASPGTYAIYNPSASDGTQNAKALCVYGCSTDASNNITLTGEFGVTVPSAPVMLGGYFRLEELPGLDSAAVTSLGGSIKEGSLGVNEVDQITIVAAGGTWGLTIPALTIGTIPISTPAVVIANTALAWNISAANLATAINNALTAAGIPAYVAVTGGVGGTNPLVVTFHGILSGQPIVITTDATQLTGGADTAAVVRNTSGVAAFGIMAF